MLQLTSRSRQEMLVISAMHIRQLIHPHFRGLYTTLRWALIPLHAQIAIAVLTHQRSRLVGRTELIQETLQQVHRERIALPALRIYRQLQIVLSVTLLLTLRPSLIF